MRKMGPKYRVIAGLACLAMMFVAPSGAWPAYVLPGGGDCEGHLVRIGTHGVVDPDFPVPISEHEGVFLDTTTGIHAIFVYEHPPQEAVYTDSSGDDVVEYYLSGQTDVSHDYCEPIVCQAMEEVAQRMQAEAFSGDSNSLIEDVKEIIRTDCAISPARPVPEANDG